VTTRINFNNITLDPITFSEEEKDTRFSILRLDKIHPQISGNKWFKLRYYLDEAIKENKKLLTFGGAWSNHILATAAACNENKIECAAIIRGEEPPSYSPVLQFAKEKGMKLFFVGREEYRDSFIPDNIPKENYLIVPQGGYGKPGAKGAGEILDHCKKEDYSHICCAAGTGTMAAGLINASTQGQKIVIISVLKNHRGLENDISALITNHEAEWKIFHEYHCGGYAKYSPELINFMKDLYIRTKIPTDFVYTGKLCYAVSRLQNDHAFPAGSNVLLIHSGGLMGNLSLSLSLPLS